MEWVESTGRSVEEAKEAALDQLGVDDQDAEFELLEEPKAGLFGRLRKEARVRARVRPTAPPAKDDRRDRQRRRRSATADGSDTPPDGEIETSTQTGSASAMTDPPLGRTATPQASSAPRASSTAKGDAAADGATSSDAVPAALGSPPPSRTRSREPRPLRASGSDVSPGGYRGQDADRGRLSGIEVPLVDQSEVARTFLSGLTAAMGLQADVVVSTVSDEVAELEVNGEGLGALIGPKGATLIAVQDLTRTVVQRKTSANNGRLFVDVQGYRHKRKLALERFVLQVAAEVVETGTPKVLEPMSAPDRKVIHDCLGDYSGVSTASEGEDPLRRVIIRPATG